MVTIIPASIQGAGTVKVSFLPALANPASPLLTELNGTDAVDLSFFFRADAFTIALAQDKVDDTRLGDATKREALGLPAYTIDNLTYIYNPQAAPTTPDNKAYTTLKEGVNGFFALRYGSKALLSSADWAATQKVGSVYQVSFGAQLKLVPTGDNAIHQIQQNVTIALVGTDITLAS